MKPVFNLLLAFVFIFNQTIFFQTSASQAPQPQAQVKITNPVDVQAPAPTVDVPPVVVDVPQPVVEPAPEPLLKAELIVECGPKGQTARLTWQTAMEKVDALPKDTQLTMQLPKYLTPEIIEGWVFESASSVLSAPFSAKGEISFKVSPEAAESVGWTVEMVDGEKNIFSAPVRFTPGAFGSIPVTGGKLEAKAYGVQVEIPEKALTGDINLCIGAVTELTLPNALSNQPFAVTAYQVDDGLAVRKFASPVKITTSYDPKYYTGKETQLTLFYFNTQYNDWAALPSQVDVKTSTLTGYSDHFTPFDYKPQSWESARLPTLDNFAVSQFTGAATYSYPIQLPPGPGGWQPSLALTYNSQAVDSATSQTQASWAGMGWSIDTGYIQRNMGENVNFYGARFNVDDDDGSDGDDTFSLVLNGQSYRLLRIINQDDNISTIDYRTEDESFLRIRRYHAHTGDNYADDSYWVIWDKSGNRYYFQDKARYPVGCSPFMVTWKWMLSGAVNQFEQEIDYTNTFESEWRVAAGELNTCYHADSQVAAYPDTITYPNGKYRVKFNTEARHDHKTIWETSDNESIFFELKRLKNITVEHKNTQGQWEQVRKIDLTYALGTIFPNLQWETSVPESKTSSLTSITEYGIDTTALPVTTFTYGDSMHLTQATNGYGGTVTYDYGGSTPLLPWYEWTVGVDALRGISDSGISSGYIGSVLDVYDPGQTYRIDLIVSPNTASCTAGILTGNNPTPYVIGEVIETETTTSPDQKVYRIAANLNTTNITPHFYFKCTSTVSTVRASVAGMVNRYRVVSKTNSESLNNSSIVQNYTYNGASTNTLSKSVEANCATPYVKKATEYRGNNSVSQKIGNLTTTTWFSQSDDTVGREHAVLTSTQSNYDSFSTIVTSPTPMWTFSGGSHVISRVDNEPILNNYSPDWNNWASTVRTAGIPYGTSSIIQFRTDNNLGIGQLMLESGTWNTNSFRQWGVKVDSSGIRVVKQKGTANAEHPKTLVEGATNKWYILMLTTGKSQFTVRLWERDNPSVYSEYFENFEENTTTYPAWIFKQYALAGNLYVDDYREAKVHSLQLTKYAAGGTYTPPTVKAPYNCPLPLNVITSPNLSWRVPVEVTAYSMDENGLFIGTRQASEYIPNGGGTQYGNPSGQTQLYFKPTTNSWIAYRKTTTEYYPVVTPTYYLVGLPALSESWACSNDDCSNKTVVASSQNIYDSNTAYNQPPSLTNLPGRGKLTRARVQVRQVGTVKYYKEQYTLYDAWGNLTSATNYTWEGVDSTFNYNGPQLSTTVYNDDNHHAYATTQTNAVGHATNTTYDYRKSVPLTITDPNNVLTTLSYDTLSRITHVFINNESTASYKFEYTLASNYFWTEASQKVDVSNNYTSVRKFYNGMGQLLQIQTPGAKVGTQTGLTIVSDTYYNNLGQANKQSVPYTKPASTGYITPDTTQPYTETTYDDLGRQTIIDPPDSDASVKTTFEYSISKLETGGSLAGIYQVTTTKDALSRATQTWKDPFGRVYRVITPQAPYIQYTYDVRDQLTRVDHLNLSYTSFANGTFTYDMGGRKTAMSDPDMGAWSYTYDALGNLTTQTDARGTLLWFTYDSINRMLEKSVGGSGGYRMAQYTYDDPAVPFSKGQRTNMKDWIYGGQTGETDWSYDDRGRIIAEIKKINVTIDTHLDFKTQWSYNQADMVTGMNYPSNATGGVETPAVTFGYLPQLLPDTVTANGINLVYSSLYDAASRLTNRTFNGGNPLVQSFQYNPWTTSGGRLNNLSAQTNGVNVQNLSYSYDVVGNINIIGDARNSNQKQCFTYDSLNRLTHALAKDNCTSGSDIGIGPYDESYAYDADNGNLTQKGTTISYTQPDPNHKHIHAASNYGTNAYTYDYNGNMITRTDGSLTYTLAYDAENRLTAISGSATATFAYDGDGKRVKTVIGGATTYYVGNYFEWTGSENTAVKYYFIGGSRIAMKTGTAAPVYLLADHLGSTHVTVAGTTVTTDVYKAWGEDRNPDTALPTPYRYTGQRDDGGLGGLLFYNARWYDPALGRFAQADSIVPQPGNPMAYDRYAYALNNPLRYNDPSGHAQACAGDDGGKGCGGKAKPSASSYSYPHFNFEGTPIEIGDLTLVPTQAQKNLGEQAENSYTEFSSSGASKTVLSKAADVVGLANDTLSFLRRNPQFHAFVTGKTRSEVETFMYLKPVKGGIQITGVAIINNSSEDIFFHSLNYGFPYSPQKLIFPDGNFATRPVIPAGTCMAIGFKPLDTIYRNQSFSVHLVVNTAESLGWVDASYFFR